MTRSTYLWLALALGVCLAAPALADAQAIPRPGTAGSTSSGSGGGEGSSAGTTTRPIEVTAPRESTPPPPPEAGQRARPPGSTTTGSATSRGGSSSGSGTSSGRTGSTDPGSGGGGTAVGRTGSSSGPDRITASGVGFGDPRGTRSRDGRPVTGVATARTSSDITVLSFPIFGPWGRWYPWYTSPFGWNGYGYVTYDPWRYGGTRWIWGRYGLWYDPYYFYDPWYYPYGLYSQPYRGGYRDERRETTPRQEVGSIRLRANPDTARVYVDGVLQGTVDDFNGLTNHLQLEAGVHQLELRADGYETWIGELTVEAGRTRTERISLKKIK